MLSRSDNASSAYASVPIASTIFRLGLFSPVKFDSSISRSTDYMKQIGTFNSSKEVWFDNTYSDESAVGGYPVASGELDEISRNELVSQYSV